MRDQKVDQNRGSYREASLDRFTGESAEATDDSLERTKLRGSYAGEAHIRVVATNCGNVVGNGVSRLDSASNSEAGGIHCQVPPPTGKPGILASWAYGN